MYEQCKWLYAIFQEHGFEACVEAFKQNIEELRYDKKLEAQKRLCLQKLSVTTADRDRYIQTEISKYEKCMRDSISQASDTDLCSVYNVISIVWNYVLSEAIIAELKQQAVELPQNVAGGNRQETITDLEMQYFKKAIEAGYMQETEHGYNWLHNNGMKASLAYFLKKVFNPDGTKITPFKMLENLFNKTNLAVATSRLLDVKKEQKCSGEIDALFEL